MRTHFNSERSHVASVRYYCVVATCCAHMKPHNGWRRGALACSHKSDNSLHTETKEIPSFSMHVTRAHRHTFAQTGGTRHTVRARAVQINNKRTCALLNSHTSRTVTSLPPVPVPVHCLRPAAANVCACASSKTTSAPAPPQSQFN